MDTESEHDSEPGEAPVAMAVEANGSRRDEIHSADSGRGGELAAEASDSDSSLDGGSIRRRARVRARPPPSASNRDDTHDAHEEAMVTVESPARSAVEAGLKGTNRRRLVVQDSDDSDGERPSAPDLPAAESNATPEKEDEARSRTERNRNERREALAALAMQRKAAEAIEAAAAAAAKSPKKRKDDHEKKRKRGSARRQERKPDTGKITTRIGQAISKFVATAALANDPSFTRRQCKEKLAAVFGEEALEIHSAFVREEFDSIVKRCFQASPEELRTMADAELRPAESPSKSTVQDADSASSSDLDTPRRLKHKDAKDPNKRKAKHQRQSKKPESKKAKAKSSQKSAEEAAKARQHYLTRHLERIIAQASLAKDLTLTKRVCRDRLAEAMGAGIEDAELEFVNGEITRISLLCREADAADQVKAWADMPVPTLQAPVEDEDKALSEDYQEASDSGSSDVDSSDTGSVSSGSVDGYASRKKKLRRPARTGVLSGMVVVPTGKELLKDQKALDTLKELLESNGAKVQSTVSHKVQFVVVANHAVLANSDSRVQSARKHAAKIVKASFFEECIRQQKVVSHADHFAVHANPKAKKAADKSKKRDKGVDHGDENDGDDDKDAREREDGHGHSDGEEGGDEEAPAVKNSRRVTVRRSKEDTEWSKEVRARFSYVKDARGRAYDSRDVVVAGATFVTHKGLLYNTYLTHTDFDDADDGQTKFYAIKLVEAGGLMKGERWHVVTQWGKVGASKPGCDVADYDDLNDALRAFQQRFWEKTRNSWESSAFAFRTVSGKFTMVELSDDEGGDDAGSEGEDAEDAPACRLDVAVRRLVSRAFSSLETDEALMMLGVDTDKLNGRKLRRNLVHEAFAELSSIQKVLQRVGGDSSKRSEKDTKRLQAHSERFAMLLHLGTEGAPALTIDTAYTVQERIRIVEAIADMSVMASAKKRCLATAAPPEGAHRLDRLYAALGCRIAPLPPDGAEAALIARMLAGAAAPEAPSPRLVTAFSVRRGGEDARFAGFARLPNRMLLWHAVRETSLVSTLVQGLSTAQPEAPAVGYPLGKGLYFYDCPGEAVAAAGLHRRAPAEFLLLCEVALGTTHETTRPAYIRRAPHGFHSTLARGRASHDPATGRARLPGPQPVEAVVAAPQPAFGAAGSSFRLNQYVVYDLAQVRIKYLCQTEVAGR